MWGLYAYVDDARARYLGSKIDRIIWFKEELVDNGQELVFDDE